MRFLEGCGAGLVQRWVQRYAARSDSRYRAAAGRLRFVSIYQTFERLYALLSYGGFVVFDDIKFTQAQEAILLPST